MSSLSKLRAELDALDRRLLETAAQRQALVARIREVKAQTGVSQFDRSRERVVFEKAATNAAEVGLDPLLAQSLMHSLVEASHRLQESERGAADISRKLLIVGGGGQMGQLLGAAFSARGHAVDVLEAPDVNPGRDRAAATASADIVMLAVPMHLAAGVARELGPHVRPDALFCDINSLKSEVCAAMLESCAGEVLGTHPMFGPSVHSLRRQKVVVCPVRPGPLGAWLTTELADLGMEIVESEPERHDRMMAVVQVLVHFRTLVMGEALRATGVPVTESLAYTSPIYRLELAIVGRLYAQDPNLYAEIEMENPFGDEVRAGFLEAAERLANVVRSGDREAFCAQFSEVSDYFSDFSADALALSDFLIDRLVERP